VGDSGLVVTVRGDFAYVAHDRYYFKAIRPTTDTGFQHYDVGVIVRYSLSRLLSIPQRFGEWQVKGLLYYSGPIDGEIRADSRVWGGVGLDFRF